MLVVFDVEISKKSITIGTDKNEIELPNGTIIDHMSCKKSSWRRAVYPYKILVHPNYFNNDIMHVPIW